MARPTAITIDSATCKKCLSCVIVCPTRRYEKTDDGIQLRDWTHLCIRCGHCMAACQTKSIQVEGLESLASMIVGHPKARFRRAIRRPLNKVHWL